MSRKQPIIFSILFFILTGFTYNLKNELKLDSYVLDLRESVLDPFNDQKYSEEITGTLSYKNVLGLDYENISFNSDISVFKSSENDLNSDYTNNYIVSKVFIEYLGESFKIGFGKTHQKFSKSILNWIMQIQDRDKSTEDEGIWQGYFSVFFSDIVFDLFYSFGLENEDESQFISKVSYSYDSFQLSVLYNKNKSKDVFGGSLNFFGDEVEVYFETNFYQSLTRYNFYEIQIGNYSEANGVELTVTDDLSLSQYKIKNPWVMRSILGFRYSFSDSFSLVFDYYYNENGYTSAQAKKIINNLYALQFTPIYLPTLNLRKIYSDFNEILDDDIFFELKKHYFFLKINVGILSLKNKVILINDLTNSLIFYTESSYLLTDSLDITFSSVFPIGEHYSVADLLYYNKYSLVLRYMF